MTAAIDYGKASVKVIVAKGGKLRAASANVDPSLKGAARAAALAEAGRTAAATVGLKPGTRVHAAVPRALAIVKGLTLPEVPADEVEPLLRFQAAKVLPFALNELALAWTALGPDSAGGQKYALAAIHEKTLSELRELIEATGFKPGRLEVSSQAAARSLDPSKTQGEVLLLDVGHATTDVMLIDGGRLGFSRSASVGAGSEGWEARLTQEVVRSLVAARTEGGASERVGPPDRVLVSGGGSTVGGLVDAVGAAIRTRAEAIAPTDLCDSSGALLEAKVAAPYFVARGLLGEVGAVPRLDFAGRAQVRATQRSRTRAVVAAIGSLLLLVAGIGGANVYLDSLESSLAERKAERDLLEPSVKRAKAVRVQLRRVAAWDARKGRELEALHAVAEALPDEDRAYLTQLRWTDGQFVHLAGRAKSGGDAEDFFSALDADPRIESARMEQVRQPRGKKRGVEFSGKLRLVDPQREVTK
ncbi:MAG: pilus assembly protein PilM [Planctomycetes bacterium]|nr:pilus assembly protein PilM [Planctomycetota bacterium]